MIYRPTGLVYFGRVLPWSLMAELVERLAVVRRFESRLTYL